MSARPSISRMSAFATNLDKLAAELFTDKRKLPQSLLAAGFLLGAASTASGVVYQTYSSGGRSSYHAEWSQVPDTENYTVVGYELCAGIKSGFYDNCITTGTFPSDAGGYADITETRNQRLYFAVRAIYSMRYAGTDYSPYSPEYILIPIADQLIRDMPGAKISYGLSDGGVELLFMKAGDPWAPVTGAIYDPPVGYTPMPNVIQDYVLDSKGTNHFIEAFVKSGTPYSIKFYKFDDIDGIVWDPVVRLDFPTNWSVLGASMTKQSTEVTVLNKYAKPEKVGGCIAIVDKTAKALRRIYITSDITRPYTDSSPYETTGFDTSFVYNARLTMKDDGSVQFFATDYTQRKAKLLTFATPVTQIPTQATFDLDKPSANGIVYAALDANLRIVSLTQQAGSADLFAANPTNGGLAVFGIDPVTMQFKMNASGTGFAASTKTPTNGGLTVFKTAYNVPDSGNPQILWSNEKYNNTMAFWKLNPTTFANMARFEVNLADGSSQIIAERVPPRAKDGREYAALPRQIMMNAKQNAEETSLVASKWGLVPPEAQVREGNIMANGAHAVIKQADGQSVLTFLPPVQPPLMLAGAPLLLRATF